MKYTYFVLVLLTTSCFFDSKKVIKSVKHGNNELVWFRDYCGSNGCDFIEIKNNSDQKLLYQAYDNSIKNIVLKNDTLVVYHSESVKKNKLPHFLEGKIFGSDVKFIPVPSHWCNYLYIVYGDCKRDYQKVDLFDQTAK